MGWGQPMWIIFKFYNIFFNPLSLLSFFDSGKLLELHVYATLLDNAGEKDLRA